MPMRASHTVRQDRRRRLALLATSKALNEQRSPTMKRAEKAQLLKVIIFTRRL